MALDLSRVSALCFDIDGTLRDTDDSLVRQFAALLRPLRYFFRDKDPNPISRQLVMTIESPGNYLHSLSDRLHLDGLMDSLEGKLYRHGLFTSVEGYQMTPGVFEMLSQLHTKYPLAVVSARGEWKTMAFLDKFELTPLFSAIATSQTCRHSKPFPDPIIWAADQMSVEPESCLMIGDTTVDIRAGKAARAQTVGVLCGFGERKELLLAGADLILSQTSDLAGILLAKSLID